jgi:hypothetical protein
VSLCLSVLHGTMMLYQGNFTAKRSMALYAFENILFVSTFLVLRIDSKNEPQGP